MNYHTTHNYEDHIGFGGIITDYDFGGYKTLSQIAEDIISDRNFDEFCKRTSENRERAKKSKQLKKHGESYAL